MLFRRPRNLRHELVRSKLDKERDKVEGMKKCGKSQSKIFICVQGGKEFEGDNKKYFISFSFNCDSEGVIYLVSCKKCRKNYVGSTVTSFGQRFNNH